MLDIAKKSVKSTAQVQRFPKLSVYFMMNGLPSLVLPASAHDNEESGFSTVSIPNGNQQDLIERSSAFQNNRNANRHILKCITNKHFRAQTQDTFHLQQKFSICKKSKK